MQYKTIVLELVQQRTEFYEQLRLTRQLLPTLNRCAAELKTIHDGWREKLSQANPQSDPLQISSEAMELAIQQLVDRLPPVSPPDGEPLSLDEAMAYLQGPTPSE